MIIFEKIDVLKTSDNNHYITWTVTSDGSDSPDDYNFVVRWSNDIESGFSEIKDQNGETIIIDGGSSSDLTIEHDRKQYNFNNKYYYKIDSYLKTGGPVSTSEAVYFGMHDDGVHIQIKHAEDTLYEMYYGEPAKIKKVKPYGENCSECWSEERGQRKKTHCNTCDGTGKIQGYYDFIKVQMSFDSDPVSSDVGHDYETTTDTKRGRLSNYPIVQPRDLVVNEDDNKRYRITHVETTKLPRRATKNKLSSQNYVVSQLITMQEIPASDPEYSID